MECDNRKQPTCNIIYEGLTPEDYYDAANLDELAEYLRDFTTGAAEEVYEIFGME